MAESTSGTQSPDPFQARTAGTDVAEMVRVLRTSAGLTQAQLAQRAATTQSMVARYESGAVSPTVRALARVVAACGQTLVLTTSEHPDRSFGDRVDPRPGISDYLNRPESGWVPGPTPRRIGGQ